MFFGLVLFGLFSSLITSISVDMSVDAMLRAPSVTGVLDLKHPKHHPICVLNGAGASFLEENDMTSEMMLIEDSIDLTDCYKLLLSDDDGDGDRGVKSHATR